MPDVRGFVVRGAAAETLRSALPGSVIARLSRGVRLVPLTQAVVSIFEGATEPHTGLPQTLLRSVQAAMGDDPLMYFSIDHARQAEQVAMLWRGDRVVKGPTRINTALEAMGVQADQGSDAMTTVGLRRFRDMSGFDGARSVAEASRVQPRAMAPAVGPPVATRGGGDWLIRLLVLAALVGGVSVVFGGPRGLVDWIRATLP